MRGHAPPVFARRPAAALAVTRRAAAALAVTRRAVDHGHGADGVSTLVELFADPVH
ncbi:hypothetical protein [Kitasatospora sp. NPDC094011]|uniref:hypothetical protein n=1 Tax=Kitasatospora sp. NPDC094011 TaxID=3364090 RepID=UPI003806A309